MPDKHTGVFVEEWNAHSCWDTPLRYAIEQAKRLALAKRVGEALMDGRAYVVRFGPLDDAEEGHVTRYRLTAEVGLLDGFLCEVGEHLWAPHGLVVVGYDFERVSEHLSERTA